MKELQAFGTGSIQWNSSQLEEYCSQNLIIALSPSLYVPFTPLFISRKLTHKTHFDHDETWRRMSVSILNLINGNDSSVIHLSRVAFLSPPCSWKNELYLASLLIAHSLNAWCLGNIFLPVIRHGKHFSLFILFIFMSHKAFLSGEFSLPVLN